MTKISFSNETPEAHDAAGYEALNWVDLGNIAPPYDDTVHYTPLVEAEPIKIKGTITTEEYLPQSSMYLMAELLRDIAIERGDIIE